MTVERIVLLITWLLTMLLIVPIRRARIRDAIFIFLASQKFTWAFSLLFVQLKLVENPVREFPRAVSSNFTFNFVFYPILTVWFCFFYLRAKRLLGKLLIALLFAAGITVFQYSAAAFTLLIKIRWLPWYMEIAFIFVTLLMTAYYYQWFLRHKQASAKGAH